MDILRDKAKEKGLSFESLAQKAGLDRSTVSRSLRKDRRPSLWVCGDLCEAMGVSLPDVVAEAERRVGK